jgi:FG-GAP-like repeat
VSVAVVASLVIADGPSMAAAADTPRFSTPVELDIGISMGLDPIRMAAGDLNGDGHADLASVQWTSGTLAVFLGKGTGAFARRVIYPTVRHPSGIAMVDVDGDGDGDVVTASANRGGAVSVFSNSGAGGLQRTGTYESSPRAHGVAVADLDRDGAVDLVTANFARRHLNVLQGTGAGRFALRRRYVGAPANDVAIGDLNGDGHLDVALATKSKQGSLIVRLGMGDGSFGTGYRYRASAHPWGLALGDLNHDGHVDMAAASYAYSSLHVLLNRGDGTFGPAARYPTGSWSEPDAVHISDFDRDGHADIATPSLNSPLMFRGRGDGTLLPPEPIGERGAFGGAVADFNGDAWPDLAFASAELSEQLWWNSVLINWTAQATPPCIVPDLQYDAYFDWGTTLRLAKRVLSSVGCRLGDVSRQFSRTVSRGQVISQAPSPKEVLPSLSPVDLVVSRGRMKRAGGRSP